MKIENIDEAFEYIKNHFKDDDTVEDVYNGEHSRSIYRAKISTLRKHHRRRLIICDASDDDTPYVCIWNGEDEGGIISKIVVPASFKEPEEIDYTKRPKMQELLDEVTKYANIGNILGAVKHYKENETPLDIQLRAFKKQQNG
jgi:hypothetical protein